MPAKNLKVLHTQVAGWPKGHVFSIDDLAGAGRGATDDEHQKAREKEAQRLIALGAVADADEPAQDIPDGPHKTARDQAAAREEEETFGDEKLPLSAFDGKSEEEITSHPGIGPVTAKEILKAQKKAVKK